MTFKKLNEGVIELKVEVPEKDPTVFVSASHLNIKDGKTITVSYNTFSYC